MSTYSARKVGPSVANSEVRPASDSRYPKASAGVEKCAPITTRFEPIAILSARANNEQSIRGCEAVGRRILGQRRRRSKCARLGATGFREAARFEIGGKVGCPDFSPDMEWVAAPSGDRTARVWRWRFN